MFLGMGYNGTPSCCMAGAAVIRLRRFSKATFACNAVREKSSATEKALLCRPHDRALPFEQVTASPRQVSGFLAPLYFFKMWYRWTCDAEASGADDLPKPGQCLVGGSLQLLGRRFLLSVLFTLLKTKHSLCKRVSTGFICWILQLSTVRDDGLCIT